MRKSPVTTTIRRAAVALALIAVVGCGGSTTTTEGSPVDSTVAESEQPTASSSTVDVNCPEPVQTSTTRLFLERNTGNWNLPPAVEVTPFGITFYDISDPDFELPRVTKLQQIPIDSAVFDRIIEDARAAGLGGPNTQPLINENNPLPIYILSLIEDGKRTSLQMIGGVDEGETGPDVPARSALFEFIKRLLFPVDGFGLSEARCYNPERYLVQGSEQPSEIAQDLDSEPPAWPLEDPSTWPVEDPSNDWPVGCRVFSGNDAVALRVTMLDRANDALWLDVDKGLWSLRVRPLMPNEPNPCT